VNWLPIGGTLFLSGDLMIEGAEFPRGLSPTKTAASGGYFSAMGIPLVRGRTFADTDRDGAAEVVIVTDGLARAIWGSADPIGQRLKIGFGRPEEQPWRTIVGVVGDVRERGLTEGTSPAVYFPPAQSPIPLLLREGLTFTIRTAGDPQDVASAVAGQVRRVDPNLPVDRVIAMRDLVANSIATPRFRGVIFGTFAITALILVATGIVGVLAYTVSRRTKEIGLRIALGAERTHVLGLVVRQAVVMTAAGLLIGIVAARALTRLIGNYLFDVTAFDPMVLGVAAFLLLGLAVAAAYVPARRAANLDPLRALRTE
jgi:putative ABC transport system permease protein